MCDCCIWDSHIVYLYTSVKLSDWQRRVHVWKVKRRDKQQDTWWVQTNKNDRWGRELVRGSVWSEDEAMIDVFARCSKKIAAQVCIEYMIMWFVFKRKKTGMPCVACVIFLMLDPILMIVRCTIIIYDSYRLFIFRRLKINHDSHEFFLESSTITNSYC